MTLKKTYLWWVIALIISSFAGYGAYLAIMQAVYGSSQGNGDLDGLPYFIGALILIVFLTGLVSSYLIYRGGIKKHHRHESSDIARSLLLFHSIAGCSMIVAFPLAFIYFNLPGLVMFFMLPFISWNFALKKAQKKKWLFVFAGVNLAIVTWAMIVLATFILSDPFRY